MGRFSQKGQFGSCCIKKCAILFVLISGLFLTLSCGEERSGRSSDKSNSAETRTSNSLKPITEISPAAQPTVSPKSSPTDPTTGDLNGQSRADMIIPGHGVGRLMLGASQSDALKIFGTSLADKFDDKGSPCHQLMLHWNEDKRGNRGIFVYLKDDKASLISVFTSRFRTVNGIKPGDSPDSLASSFPTLEAFKLVNSGSDVDGGKDLIYWVDLHDGIAFGLYYFPNLKRRMIKEIDVFPAGATFQPEGCVEAPQEWQKISTFDLN